MNSKIILAAVAMTFVAGVAAHADENRRPQRPAQQPQQEQRFEDEDLDEEYHRPSRYNQAPPRQEYRSRQEYYCQQPRCQAPEVLPYPNAPIFAPVPLPRPISGVCTVVPRNYGGNWGWVILVNNQFEVARGLRHESPNVPHLRQQLMWSGVCLTFIN